MNKVNAISGILSSLRARQFVGLVKKRTKACLPFISKPENTPKSDVFERLNPTNSNKTKKLRSMQNINGVEREIIEMYHNELKHLIWGDKDKLLSCK
jgi:hypothetical protein